MMKAIHVCFLFLLTTLILSCNTGDDDVIVTADSIKTIDLGRNAMHGIAPVILGPDEVEQHKPFGLQIDHCDYAGASITWTPALSCPNVRITPCGLCGTIDKTTTFAVTIRQGRQSRTGYKTVHVK